MTFGGKDPRMLVSQGREGNVTCLKRRLWEMQDTIMQLHEAQSASEEHNMKYLREREAVRDKVCEDLDNAPKRHG